MTAANPFLKCQNCSNSCLYCFCRKSVNYFSQEEMKGKSSMTWINARVSVNKSHLQFFHKISQQPKKICIYHNRFAIFHLYKWLMQSFLHMINSAWNLKYLNIKGLFEIINQMCKCQLLQWISIYIAQSIKYQLLNMF